MTRLSGSRSSADCVSKCKDGVGQLVAMTALIPAARPSVVLAVSDIGARHEDGIDDDQLAQVWRMIDLL
jgi:hypothetical protein